MDITIRLEQPGDYRDVENLTREAFWNVYKPGCDEHFILHNLRNVSAFVPELCFVACDGSAIVGNIVYSKATIIGEDGRKFEVLCMGPLSVMPSYQKQGIGSLLMNHSIGRARQLGFKAVVIFGNPGYYQRFGYENAQKFGISTSSGENFDAFMVLPLSEGSLNGISGRFYEDGVFISDANKLEQFDKQFSYKEKLVTDTQLKH